MKKHWIPFVLIIMSIVISVVAYPHLPAQVPIHWNIDGEVNNYASKLFGLSVMPVMLIVMYGLLIFLPKIDPKKENYKGFMGSYRIIIYSIMGFLLVMQAITILVPLGYDINMNMVVFILVGFLFIILGNYMQRAKQNFFIGIRTPWTLSNETVWKKTHRLTAKLYVVAGICIVIGAFLPTAFQLPIILAFTIITVLVSYVASYMFYKKETGEQ